MTKFQLDADIAIVPGQDGKGDILLVVVNAIGGTAAAALPNAPSITVAIDIVTVDRGSFGQICLPELTDFEIEILESRGEAEVIEVDEEGPAVHYTAKLSH